MFLQDEFLDVGLMITQGGHFQWYHQIAFLKVFPILF